MEALGSELRITFKERRRDLLRPIESKGPKAKSFAARSKIIISGLRVFSCSSFNSCFKKLKIRAPLIPTL